MFYFQCMSVTAILIKAKVSMLANVIAISLLIAGDHHNSLVVSKINTYPLSPCSWDDVVENRFNHSRILK